MAHVECERSALSTKSEDAEVNSHTLEGSETFKEGVEPYEPTNAKNGARGAVQPAVSEGESKSFPDSQSIPQECIYRLGKELGKGTYSIVNEAIHTESKKLYAAKVINKRLMSGREHLVHNEVVVLKRVSAGHSNIVTLVDYFETETDLYLITELCRGGELFDRIYSKGPFYECETAALVRQVTMGVSYLHSQGIVHRDLKLENLLLKTQGARPQILIADFGLSRIIDEEKLKVLMTTCGTPSYMAPEIFTKNGHAKPVDIWALGIITYFLLCGYPPFDRETVAEEREAILRGEFEFEPEDIWAHITQDAVAFIKSCLALNPLERMTAQECLEHPFLTRKYRQDHDFVANVYSTDLIPSQLEGKGMLGAFCLAPKSREGFN